MVLSLFNRIQRHRLLRAGFQPRTVQTGECEIEALELAGSGELPPLVVVHGICAEGAQFADTLLKLKPHFSRIVVPDLPGHGNSGDPRSGLTSRSLSDSVHELFDELIDEPSLVVGNSLGGMVSVRYALASPDKVRALYLSSPGGGQQADFQGFLDRFRLDSWSDGVAFAGQLYGRPPLHRYLIGGGVRGLFARTEMARFVGELREEDLLTSEDLGALLPPAHVAWGGRDWLLTREQFDFYRASLPRESTFEEPSHWGHCPYLDTPGELADSILNWARRDGQVQQTQEPRSPDIASSRAPS